MGVLMTICDALRTKLQILGVLNATFSHIFRNIGGALAPPAPPVPPALIKSDLVLKGPGVDQRPKLQSRNEDYCGLHIM